MVVPYILTYFRLSLPILLTRVRWTRRGKGKGFNRVVYLYQRDVSVKDGPFFSYSPSVSQRDCKILRWVLQLRPKWSTPYDPLYRTELTGSQSVFVSFNDYVSRTTMETKGLSTRRASPYSRLEYRVGVSIIRPREVFVSPFMLNWTRGSDDQRPESESWV